MGSPAGSGPDAGQPERGRGPSAVPRSVDCPFLRLESDGLLVDPEPLPSDDHRCVAIGGSRLLSRQQQELVCLGAAHVDCPRYRRRVAPPGGSVHGSIRTPPVPRAIAAALVVLALSAGISFGFVIQRGGIDLPTSAVPPGTASGAAGPVTTPASSPAADAVATPAPTGAPTGQPASSPAPTGAASPPPTPGATTAPTPTPSPRPPASGGPSASRLAVLKPCPGQSGCYVYTVRTGDNLYSIAHWFGVPLDTVYAWNPASMHGIRPGEQLKIPTPTR